MTTVASPVRFKIATEDWEFDAIHQLNYATFVEEIPQHSKRPERRLVDRFHDQNTYFIALRDRTLLGMVAFRSKRPFSLDSKLPNLDSYLPPGRRVCEVRLLAATQACRNGLVFRGLVDALIRHVVQNGFDTAVLSGTVRQLKLYQHMGCVPFGPLVGSGDAMYQPMYLTLEAFREQGKAIPYLQEPPRPSRTLNFLPGPVAVHDDVKAAFQRPALSHRALSFVQDVHDTRRRLCELTQARHVQLMMGSGTLANDIVAAQISTWQTPGLVLSNGAFGERLIDHARRFQLDFQTHEIPWGKPFDPAGLEAALTPSHRWLWVVHGETSTGVLNDLNLLKDLAHSRGLRLCLDAVSSLGNISTDLSDVALASGVSGKGWGAFSGLALVFHAEPPPRNAALPRYLDLGYYAASDGIPFTLSSQLVHALQAALARFPGDAHYHRLAQLSERLRAGVQALGLTVVAEQSPFPAVTTFVVPVGRESLQIGQQLEDGGCLLNYRSSHLPSRNWMQACLMGEVPADAVEVLLGHLRRVFDHG